MIILSPLVHGNTEAVHVYKEISDKTDAQELIDSLRKATEYVRSDSKAMDAGFYTTLDFLPDFDENDLNQNTKLFYDKNKKVNFDIANDCYLDKIYARNDGVRSRFNMRHAGMRCGEKECYFVAYDADIGEYVQSLYYCQTEALIEVLENYIREE